MRYLLLIGGILALIVYLGCEDRDPSRNTLEPGFGTLKTVEHDGHKFVLATMRLSGDSISVIHHPGCECLQKAEKGPREEGK